MKWGFQILITLLLPPVESVYLFGISREVATVQCCFNRQYYWHLRQMRELYPGDSVLPCVIEETEELYRVWDNLRDALTTHCSDGIRQTALCRLREKIGAEAYHRGEMPPHVPLWRFVEVK